MESKDIEQLLRKAKFMHLSEETLVSYRDRELDKIGLTLADAHLKLCLICDRRLEFLKEEAEALESYEVTEQDRASIKDTIRMMEPKPRSIQTHIERLRSYIEDLLTAWIVPFSQPAMRGSEDGEEVWRYESEDKLLKAWAVLEQNFSLTVHFESTDLSWEGVRIQFRLGPFSKEVTLEREGDAKVSAKIEIPRRQLARNMADISIEIL